MVTIALLLVAAGGSGSAPKTPPSAYRSFYGYDAFCVGTDRRHPMPKWVEDIETLSYEKQLEKLRARTVREQIEFAVFALNIHHPPRMEWVREVMRDHASEVTELLPGMIKGEKSDKFLNGLAWFVYVATGRTWVPPRTLLDALRARLCEYRPVLREMRCPDEIGQIEAELERLNAKPH